jgi:hypothetical protein
MCTGQFRYKYSGEIAGSDAGNYIRLSVDNILWRAHQIAWLWMTGEWPPEYIDHINLDKHDNRFSNLRAATKSQNAANRPRRSNNTSGLKGVHRYKAGDVHGKPWQSSIQYQKRKIYLGQFPTKEAAHIAYRDAAKKYYGEFGRSE